MANDNEILKRIKNKIGIGMTYNRDFETLAQAIEDETGEMLGVSTLKRLFGFKMEKVVPRESTMDILSRYLGYSDYAMMLKDLGPDADISIFTPIDSIESLELKAGVQIQVTYDPNRIFILSYLGDNKYIVNEIEGSKNIKQGDVLMISQLAVGFPLIVSQVVREGKNLGKYVAAQERGLKSIEIMN